MLRKSYRKKRNDDFPVEIKQHTLAFYNTIESPVNTRNTVFRICYRRDKLFKICMLRISYLIEFKRIVAKLRIGYRDYSYVLVIIGYELVI